MVYTNLNLIVKRLVLHEWKEPVRASKYARFPLWKQLEQVHSSALLHEADMAGTCGTCTCERAHTFFCCADPNRAVKRKNRARLGSSMQTLTEDQECSQDQRSIASI